MDRKHDLDSDEICSEKVSDESKITPRLRAESVSFILLIFYFIIQVVLEVGYKKKIGLKQLYKNKRTQYKLKKLVPNLAKMCIHNE